MVNKYFACGDALYESYDLPAGVFRECLKVEVDVVLVESDRFNIEVVPVLESFAGRFDSVFNFGRERLSSVLYGQLYVVEAFRYVVVPSPDALTHVVILPFLNSSLRTSAGSS